MKHSLLNACLFYSKAGALSVKLLDSPVPPEVSDPPMPMGASHACKLLGFSPRIFKRTVDGAIPVFEEQ